MPFPVGWPPRPEEGMRNIRVFIEGETEGDFENKAFLFFDVVGAVQTVPTPIVEPGSTETVNLGTPPFGGGVSTPDDPKPQIWSDNVRVVNLDPTNFLEFSFDGVNVHGKIGPESGLSYRNRSEGGIALRGKSPANVIVDNVPFIVEAW